jgi:hypothetical protein
MEKGEKEKGGWNKVKRTKDKKKLWGIRYRV